MSAGVSLLAIFCNAASKISRASSLLQGFKHHIQQGGTQGFAMGVGASERVVGQGPGIRLMKKSLQG